jgi:hypothetical protein
MKNIESIGSKGFISSFKDRIMSGLGRKSAGSALQNRDADLQSSSGQPQGGDIVELGQDTGFVDIGAEIKERFGSVPGTVFNGTTVKPGGNNGTAVKSTPDKSGISSKEAVNDTKEPGMFKQELSGLQKKLLSRLDEIEQADTSQKRRKEIAIARNMVNNLDHLCEGGVTGAVFSLVTGLGLGVGTLPAIGIGALVFTALYVTTKD